MTLGIPAAVEGRGAGDLLSVAPGAVPLADHERLSQVGRVDVLPASAAIARRCARQRSETEPNARAIDKDLFRFTPGAVLLPDHERLVVRGADRIVSASAAVARRCARQRNERNARAIDKDSFRFTPGAVLLPDHEGPSVREVVLIEPAGAAVARRCARHPDVCVPARVAGSSAWDLLGLAPDPARGATSIGSRRRRYGTEAGRNLPDRCGTAASRQAGDKGSCCYRAASPWSDHDEPGLVEDPMCFNPKCSCSASGSPAPYR